MIRVDKGDPPACLIDEGPALVAVDYQRYDAIADKGNLSKSERDSFKPNPVYRSHAVKAALVEAQAGEKCVYCEKDLAEDGKHVDHFRPYGAIETIDGKIHPGYFWLAYTWSNLYLACFACNTSYKKDKFPLSNPDARVRPPNVDLTVEEPLLVDPGFENPREYIRFRRDAPYAFNASLKGKTTIEVLNLNRPGLRSARHTRFGLLETLRDVVEIFRDNPTYIQLQAKAEDSLTILQDAVKRSAAFSSMAKDFLDEFLADFESA